MGFGLEVQDRFCKSKAVHRGHFFRVFREWEAPVKYWCPGNIKEADK